MVLLWLRGKKRRETPRKGIRGTKKRASTALRATEGGENEARSGLVTFALGSGRELIRPRKGVSV